MDRLTLIGFGEAAQVFTASAGWCDAAAAFDIKTLDDGLRVQKLADYAAVGVCGFDSVDAALDGSPRILSLVTADQALGAAQAAASRIAPDALYFDMNSVAPATKRAAAEAIETAGGRYVDVAIMAPVLPGRMQVPLLVSGPHRAAGVVALAAIGFANVTEAGEQIGQASAIKMIRSVLVKGVEAVTAECVIAAQAAGLTGPVLASLGADWAAKADYTLDRMLAHGLRRASEMEESAATLEELGIDPVMTRGTILRQRALGALGVGPIPAGLDAKLAAIAPRDDRKGAA
jgi:3-hydroxyisobutyrate dehydrogenase-like beta-hydroxyacid dehydrogenase